jgi:hypothetical protein
METRGFFWKRDGNEAENHGNENRVKSTSLVSMVSVWFRHPCDDPERLDFDLENRRQAFSMPLDCSLID